MTYFVQHLYDDVIDGDDTSCAELLAFDTLDDARIAAHAFIADGDQASLWINTDDGSRQSLPLS